MKQIFYNGNIITYNNCNIEAILVVDGIIKELGNKEEIINNNKDSELIDLNNNTLIPAFVDSHSHLSSYANNFLQISLNNCKSFSDIIYKLKSKNIKKGEWIIASGYDHNLLEEKIHPNKELLDKYFIDNPVVIQHKTGHFGVFNSLALNKLNLNTNDGYFEEDKFVNAIRKIPSKGINELIDAYKLALKEYASYGITTLQEGMMVDEMIPIYHALIDNEILNLDVIGYPSIENDIFLAEFRNCINEYHNNFKIGGYKIILDGSPQGLTAWMKEPYKNKSFGVSLMSNNMVYNAYNKAINNNMQLLAHCNGNMAIQQFIDEAYLFNVEDLKKIRPVIIHSQFMDINQLKDVKRLNLIPSYFADHCYYYGDIHIDNLGYKKASMISPLNSTIKNEILFTMHQDSPVVKPDMINTIWVACNRITKNGVLLNEDECITPLEALKALTINAAYQYHEENIKGSIDINKQANFVVLDENILTIDKKLINTISILQTYKLGKRIY